MDKYKLGQLTKRKVHKMKETEWVETVLKKITINSIIKSDDFRVGAQKKLPYGYEVRSYGNEPMSKAIKYKTDLLISEKIGEKLWKPRVVIEAKIGKISTHDSITYSEKAKAHKSVHPYLRYGVILTNRKHYPLPGRLYRHGKEFDFMLSFKSFKPTRQEKERFFKLINVEIFTSKKLEHIIYSSRKKDREHYTMFHRKLILE